MKIKDFVCCLILTDFVNVSNKVKTTNNDNKRFIVGIIRVITSFCFQLELWVDKIFQSRVTKIKDDTTS